VSSIPGQNAAMKVLAILGSAGRWPAIAGGSPATILAKRARFKKRFVEPPKPSRRGDCSQN
jgi:hypothetical protein